jgi:sporulation and cell division protein SsgA
VNESGFSSTLLFAFLNPDGPEIPCPTTVSYDGHAAPYHINFLFCWIKNSLPYRFSRETLAAGLEARPEDCMTDGGVRIWQQGMDENALLIIQIEVGANETVQMNTQSRAMAELLNRTYEIVPRGQELDDELRQILPPDSQT